MNATGVLITAKIPEKTTLIEGSISPEGYEIKDGSIVWNLGSMAINHDFNFKYSLEVQEGFTDYEKITGSASLKSGQGQEASIRAEGEVRLFPDLGSSTVSMNDKDGGNLWAGDKVVVKAVLANDGERSAEQVILNCPVPENSSYVKGSATCRDAEISFDNNKVIFVIPEIKPGESSEAVFEIQVSPKMSSGGAIDASFDLSANGIEFVLPDSEIKVKANYQVTVACLGDSLIALSNWPQILDSLLEATYAHSDYNIIASGIKGEMAPGGYNRFDDSIAKYKPQIVIVGYGTNDIGSGTDKFSHYLSAIVQKIKNINATPFIESLGYINVNMEPLKADWASYQSVIYQTGDFYNVPVIDIYSPLSSDPGTYIADWVHYTPEGSSVVAHTIYNYIVRYLDSEGRRK
jgi:lysophospholipase L1-like esterase